MSIKKPNNVLVYIATEHGDKIEDGDYMVKIGQLIGDLDITSPGGTDDITLILDCIANNLDKLRLPEEGVTEVLLTETGEQEDVFWHKYYEISRIDRYSLN